MKTAFIAAPMPKTGSSYIQANLSLNRENLLSQGINYPKSELDEKAKKGGVTTGNGLLLISETHEIESGDKGVLYHSEMLFKRLLAEEGKFLKDLINNLKQKELKPVFIVYGRNILSHSYSCYTQRVVSRGIVQTYPSFIENNFNLLDEFIELHTLIQSHGCELRFFNYSNIPGDPFEHFLYEACAIDKSTEFKKIPMRVNSSIPHSDVGLIMALNSIVFKRDTDKVRDLKKISRKLLANNTTINTENAESTNPEQHTNKKQNKIKPFFNVLLSKISSKLITNNHSNSDNPYPISDKTYKTLESKHGETVMKINKLIPHNEKLEIEPLDTVKTTGDDLFLVTRKSIKTILKAASEHDNNSSNNTKS